MHEFKPPVGEAKNQGFANLRELARGEFFRQFRIGTDVGRRKFGPHRARRVNWERGMFFDVPIASSQRSGKIADERDRRTFGANKLLDVGAGEWQFGSPGWRVLPEPFARNERGADLTLEVRN